MSFDKEGPQRAWRISLGHDAIRPGNINAAWWPQNTTEAWWHHADKYHGNLMVPDWRTSQKPNGLRLRNITEAWWAQTKISLRSDGNTSTSQTQLITYVKSKSQNQHSSRCRPCGFGRTTIYNCTYIPPGWWIGVGLWWPTCGWSLAEPNNEHDFPQLCIYLDMLESYISTDRSRLFSFNVLVDYVASTDVMRMEDEWQIAEKPNYLWGLPSREIELPTPRVCAGNMRVLIKCLRKLTFLCSVYLPHKKNDITHLVSKGTFTFRIPHAGIICEPGAESFEFIVPPLGPVFTKNLFSW